MPELLLEAMSASSASSSEIEVMHIEENADGSAGISGSTASSSSSSPSAATVQPLSQPQQQQPQPQPIGIAQQPIRFNFHAVCSPSTWCWWEPVLYALFTLHSASMDRELRSASLAAAASWMQRVLVRPAAALGAAAGRSRLGLRRFQYVDEFRRQCGHHDSGIGFSCAVGRNSLYT